VKIELRNLWFARLQRDGDSSSSEVWGQSLSFAAPDRICFVGGSGTGKTTLLHTIYGICPYLATDSTLMVDGRDVCELTEPEWSRIRCEKMAMAFQDLRLFPHLTGLENILLKAALTNVTAIDDILTWAAQIGMSDALQRPCAAMSLGEQQRVAVLRALCQPFSWLLLDEPFSHVDDETTGLMCELLVARCAEQDAGLIVTSLGGTCRFIGTREYCL